MTEGKQAIEETLNLVSAAQSGDRPALEELFRRYLPRTRRMVALRLGWRSWEVEEREDIVQGALLRVLRALERFKPRSEGSFRNWIASCVKSELVDTWRLQARRPGDFKRVTDCCSEDLTATVLAGSVPRPSEFAKKKELNEKLEEALLALPEQNREIIIQRQLAEMSYREIAESMGFAKESTARKVFQRSLKKLKQLLDLPTTD